MPADAEAPLNEEKCIACRPGAPRVEGDELRELRARLLPELTPLRLARDPLKDDRY